MERFIFSAESKQTLIDGLKNFEYAADGQGRLKTAARGPATTTTSSPWPSLCTALGHRERED